MMVRVTSTDFQQNVGAYSDTALQEPVIITSHNRDRLVLMGVEEYKKLKSLADSMKDDTDALMDQIVDDHRGTLEKLAQK